MHLKKLENRLSAGNWRNRYSGVMMVVYLVCAVCLTGDNDSDE